MTLIGRILCVCRGNSDLARGGLWYQLYPLGHHPHPIMQNKNARRARRGIALRDAIFADRGLNAERVDHHTPHLESQE